MNIKLVISLSTTLLLCNGCTSFIGKDVMTEVNPNFNISQYKRAYVDFDDNSSTLMQSIDVFFEKQGFVGYNSLAVSRKGDLFVYVTMEKGFCLPPKAGMHFDIVFTLPKKATVTVLDSLSKETLLKCSYVRGLFATNAGFVECEDLILESLKKAFAEQRKKANVSHPPPDDKK
ncbi:MAG: hypothetical protein WCV67_05585 [Victivallaceae bacterium]|jgi:hypothetical protein